MRGLLQAAFAGRPVDWCLQSAPVRPRRLLVCDMDSTIISCECLDEIAAILGIYSEIAQITEQAMRGELAFEPALEARVARLKGARVSDLERVMAERVRLNPGAATLVATMRARGARTVLVSGGFTFFTEAVATLAGFEVSQGNRLEIEDGALTGRVLPPILGRHAKRQAMERHAAELGIALAESVAIGDGANDLDMIEAAGLGIAYRAKPMVEARAFARIASGDLRSALLFQGVAPAEFVERG
jgi:phosphoserine phosphatase